MTLVEIRRVAIPKIPEYLSVNSSCTSFKFKNWQSFRRLQEK